VAAAPNRRGEAIKFEVTFKTADAVEDAIVWRLGPVNPDEPDDLRGDMRRVAKRFVKYGEYVTVEFDTEAGTATVVPIG
jgi:hypothetical protein